VTALDDRSGPAAYRLSRERLADLATGGDHPETVRFLADTQYSRRLLLLYELRNRASSGLGPLPPVDEAWDAMQRAQAHDPKIFESVVMHPQIGNWAAYAVRRHLEGSAGEPSWFDLGQIHAVALVAAARAGQVWHTRVPLRDGRATLPGLGQAWLGTAPPRAWAAAETAAGRIRISYRDAGVDVPEDPRSDADGWWGLRCLTAGDGPVLRVVLDDLDFFRNLADPVGPERLTDDEVNHWQRMLEEAWDLLCRDDRVAARALALAVSSLAPLARADQDDEDEIRSASSAEAFGAVVLSTPHDAADFAATLVHEGRHIKLGCLMHLRDLHTDDGRSELYAPWRDDPRPLGGLIQGIYAFFGIARFWRTRMRRTTGAERDIATFEYAYARRQTVESVHIGLAAPGLTAAGRTLLEGLRDQAEEWPADPSEVVEPRIARLVQLTADSHRLGWRLRHRRPAAGEVAALAALIERGEAPQPGSVTPAAIEPHPALRWRQRIPVAARRHAVAGDGPRPAGADPVSMAESALLAQDAPAARRAFTDALGELATDPRSPISDDEARAWAGLAMSLAAEGDAPAADALRRRPDLVRAVHTGTTAGRRLTPVEVARRLAPAVAPAG